MNNILRFSTGVAVLVLVGLLSQPGTAAAQNCSICDGNNECGTPVLFGWTNGCDFVEMCEFGSCWTDCLAPTGSTMCEIIPEAVSLSGQVVWSADEIQGLEGRERVVRDENGVLRTSCGAMLVLESRDVESRRTPEVVRTTSSEGTRILLPSW